MCHYSPERIAAAIDLAALKPQHARGDIIRICSLAKEFNCASVCVKPNYVIEAAQQLANSTVAVGTVVNFPHGNSMPAVAALEAYNAIGDGAHELDVVINIGAALTGQWGIVLDGLEAVIAIGHEWDAIVKVILEICYLPTFTIRQVCRICADLTADFVKTSTGFGIHGATPEAVILMRDTVDGKCQIKASGGIQTYKDAELYLDLGCVRLGTSRVEELMPY